MAALYAPEGEVTSLLRLRWGSRFMNTDGSVNKTALLEAMRDDSAFRGELEAIVHPFVYASLERFWQSAEEQSAELAVAEVPLWFESQGRYMRKGKSKTGDGVVVGVACNRQIRHERLRMRRGWSEELIALMDSWQWTEEAKMAACDIVVDNSHTLEDLKKQAGPLAHEVQQRAAQQQQLWQAAVRSQLEELQRRLNKEAEQADNA